MLKVSDLATIPGLLIKDNEPLAKYTYTKVGGPADLLVFPVGIDMAKELLALARQTDTPVTILGQASNLIVRDGGIRGLVISLAKLAELKLTGTVIEAGAGCQFQEVSRFGGRNALTGLEFACGIPGSVGGAVYMNAGAYGGEVADVFESCQVLDMSGASLKLVADDMNFGYRYSIIRDQNLIVLSAIFKLRPGDQTLIQQQMANLTNRRRSSQPLNYPSCGSVFKRPPGHFTGQLIQRAGLQGFRIGGVEVSRKHAGFMVNVGQATATDYEQLIDYVANQVRARFGVSLEPEVRIIGDYK